MLHGRKKNLSYLCINRQRRRRRRKKAWRAKKEKKQKKHSIYEHKT